MLNKIFDTITIDEKFANQVNGKCFYLKDLIGFKDGYLSFCKFTKTKNGIKTEFLGCTKNSVYHNICSDKYGTYDVFDAHCGEIVKLIINNNHHICEISSEEYEKVHKFIKEQEKKLKQMESDFKQIKSIFETK